jgi:hypothetical protein
MKVGEAPLSMLEIDVGVGPEAKVALPVPLRVRLDGTTVFAAADPLL